MTIQLGIFAKRGQVVRDSEGRKIGRVGQNYGGKFILRRGLFRRSKAIAHHSVTGLRGKNIYLDTHRRDL